MEKRERTERELERIVKGFANHRRIEILRLLQKRPELSVYEVCQLLHISVKTGSEHIRRLDVAGLVVKRHAGRWVRHRLTERATGVLTFLRTLE